MIDRKRQQAGMAPVAVAKPDRYSHFLHCQVEYIEFAGMPGLGEFGGDRINVSRVRLA